MATGFIDVWHGQYSGEDQPCSRYWHLLSRDEQVKAGTLKNTLPRDRYVEMQARLRQLLAQLLNQAPEKIAIKKTEFGKPYLADFPELVFNVSHSGNRFVIATGTNCRLGVDIEQCRPRADLSGLMNRCFSEQEIAHCSNLPEAHQETEFYRFWTRKEAFVKAVGRGLALGLKQCVVNPAHPVELLSVPDGCGPADIWRLAEIDPGRGFCGALVADQAIAGVRLMALNG